jgi:hypothetical protein
MTPLFTPLSKTEMDLLAEQILSPETVLNLPIENRNSYHEQSTSVFDPAGHNSEFYL